MKKLLFLLACAMYGTTMQAGLISEQEALQKAKSFMSGKSFKERNLHRAPLADNDNNAYYVFNVENDAGFIIVGNDDNISDVLAYSENNSFNPETVPNELKIWLNSYSAISQVPKTHNAIPPMTTTEWGQKKPYNALLANNDATGCVATALAQLMAYHKWPNEVSKEVYELPTTSFNWDLMRNQYSENDVDESALEVAKLMKYCGFAVNTNYNSSSKAYFYNMCEALKYYFGYAETAHDIYRISYTTEEWDNILYNELSNGRPVLYSAQESSGHALICDGYDGNGFYHFNWGWSGDCNGYYRLPSLNNYSLDHAAIVGIEKAIAPYDYEKKLSYGIIEEWTYHSIRKRNANGQVGVGFKIAWNEWNSQIGEDKMYEAAGGLYKDHKLIEVLPITYSTRISDRPSFIYAVRIGSNVPDGNYQLRMLYRKTDSEKWIEPLRSDGEFFDLYIKSDSLIIKQRGNAYAYPKEDEIKIVSMKVEGNLQVDTQQTLVIDMQNTGTANAGKLDAIIRSAYGYVFNGSFGYSINPGETGKVELYFTPTKAGEYEIIIRSDDRYKTIGSSTFVIDEKTSSIAIANDDSQKEPTDIWSVDGRKANLGNINIVRYGDGTTKKVIKK